MPLPETRIFFWKENYGFHPKLANFIRKNFPKVRIFGFDSISISSFTDRILGREAHKAFLDPNILFYF